MELPSGYNRVWTNKSVEYVLASDPNFNPNVGYNRDWQVLRKAE